MNMIEAKQVVAHVQAVLGPLCEYLEVVGEYRRNVTTDLEKLVFVARPKPQCMMDIMNNVPQFGHMVDREQDKGLMNIRTHHTNLKRIVIYWAAKGQVGGLVFEQTGPEFFVERAKRFWSDKAPGNKLNDGWLIREGNVVDCETELDFFREFGINPIRPEKRR